MRKKMKLSQCMIVKNEEKNIERALSWGKGIVCEQIVVDTGSTDRTVEIAKEMGAKVFEFTWINDFAAAKNFAISKAMGDWIAFLDADEYFLEKDAKKLPKILELLERKSFFENGKKGKANVIKTDWVQLNEKGDIFGVPEQIRIFRNKSYIRYYGAIHEQIATTVESGKHLFIVDMTGQLAIYHTGYAWTLEKAQEKSERNLTLLKEELKENPDCAAIKMYMAESLLINGKTIEAISFARQASQNEDNSLSKDRLLSAYQFVLYELYDLRLKKLVLPEEEKFDVEAFYTKAVQMNETYPDFDIAMGLNSFLDKDWEKICIYFERALKKSLQMKKIKYSRVTEYLGTIYKALAISYGNLEQWNKAVHYVTISLEIDKFQEGILIPVLQKFSIEKTISSEEVLHYLKKLYNFDKKKELFFVLKCAKQIRNRELEEMLKSYLTEEDKIILYPPHKKITEKDFSHMIGIEHDFYMLFETILNTSEKNLVFIMQENLKKVKLETPQKYQTIIGNYNYWGYWGKIQLEKNQLELLENRAKELKEHINDFLWLYEKLEDFRSKKILFYIIQNWLNFDTSLLSHSIENVYYQYFDLDILLCDETEVVVDLGAFQGDTYDAYIKTYGEEKYQAYYCYEISDENLQKLKEKFSDNQKVIIRNKAAADKSGKTKIIENKDFPTANIISEEGEIEIEMVSIDEDISEKITFLKMDIEGAEQKAIMGSKNHIKNEKPKLAISIYHKNEDLWKIPKMISEINPEYKFYLRYYGGDIYPSEYILVAI